MPNTKANIVSFKQTYKQAERKQTFAAKDIHTGLIQDLTQFVERAQSPQSAAAEPIPVQTHVTELRRILERYLS